VHLKVGGGDTPHPPPYEISHGGLRPTSGDLERDPRDSQNLRRDMLNTGGRPAGPARDQSDENRKFKKNQNRKKYEKLT